MYFDSGMQATPKKKKKKKKKLADCANNSSYVAKIPKPVVPKKLRYSDWFLQK